MMSNTTRYRMVTDDGELIFMAYFNPDGSVGSSDPKIRGFWHVDERDFFCYALTGMPVSVGQMFDTVLPMLKSTGFSQLHYHRKGKRQAVPIMA